MTSFGPVWVLYHLFSDWWQVLALFWVLYHLFLTVFRFWHCLSIVLSFSELWQVLSMSKYCTVYFLTGDRVWLELSFCCILWLVTRLTPRFFFLTVGRLLCLTIVPSISDWWQLLALFEYCTIFFWLVKGFGPVWVLYHLFLTGDRFVLFENCTIYFWLLTGFGPGWVFYIFFWLVTGFGSIWVLYHFFRTVSRFWHCLRIVPSFSDR